MKVLIRRGCRRNTKPDEKTEETTEAIPSWNNRVKGTARQYVARYSKSIILFRANILDRDLDANQS